MNENVVSSSLCQYFSMILVRIIIEHSLIPLSQSRTNNLLKLLNCPFYTTFINVKTYREYLYRFKKETSSNNYRSNDTDKDLLLSSLVHVTVKVYCFCATGIICSTFP